MNEMFMAKLIAEEVVNELINRGVISVRGGNTGYNPDRRIVPADPTVDYDDVVRAVNEAVRNGAIYNTTRNSLLSIIPVDGKEQYFKAVIEIIKDDNTLPTSKLELVRRITSKYGYSK